MHKHTITARIKSNDIRVVRNFPTHQCNSCGQFLFFCGSLKDSALTSYINNSANADQMLTLLRL